MTAGKDHPFLRLPPIKALSYLNATLKPWILLGNFFHHLNLMRGWTFSGPNYVLGSILFGGTKLDAKGLPTPVREMSVEGRVMGMLRGLRDSVSWRKATMNGLTLLENRDPVIMRLIGKGLTVPNMADMLGTTRARGMFDTLLRAMGSSKASDLAAAGRILRGRSEHFLFGTLGSGLKMMWAYGHFMREVQRELKAGRTPDLDKISEIVADAANTTFGGQHLGRHGRNNLLTWLLRQVMLAPDWAVSQLKPAYAAIPGLPKLVTKLLNEMPPPKGYSTFYRKMLLKMVLSAAIATVIMQVLINGDSEEGPWEMYREQLSDWTTAKHLRWTMVDVTRMYRSLNHLREQMGLDPVEIDPDERIMFSLAGYMIAPLRLFEIGRFFAAKGSPFVRVMEPFISGEDWRGRPYKTLSDLWNSYQFPDRPSSKGFVKGAREQNPRDVSQFPAITAAAFRDMQPLQIGQMLRWLQGEQDGILTAAKSLGLEFSVARDPRVAFKQFQKIEALSREEWRDVKRSLYRKDFDPAKLPRTDVEAFVAVSMRGMLHKASMLAGKAREGIVEAKENKEYTYDARQERIKYLRGVEDGFYKTAVAAFNFYVEGLRAGKIKVTPEQAETMRRELEGEK